MDCLFCKIIHKTIPTTFVYEDEQIVAFKDIHPKASVHVLVVPKKHIVSLVEITPEEHDLMGHVMQLLPKIAEQQGLTNGFRTIVNTGPGGGQEIGHLHFHVLGGGRLPAF